MHWWIYFVAKFLILCNLNFAFVSSKALIGENVRLVLPGDFEYVVSLMMIHPEDNDLIKHFCSGSLVSHRDVVTAEHCMLNRPLNEVRVGAECFSLIHCTRYQVSWWMGFNQWSQQNNFKLSYPVNDIAVIRLQNNVTSLLKPVALSNLRVPQLYHSTVSLAGWGQNEENNTPLTMQTVDVNVLTIEDCQRRIRRKNEKYFYFTQAVFCTHAVPYALMHQGDSGGPVIYMNTLVGIMKGTYLHQDLVAHPDKLNVHFGIYIYRNFIYDVIETM